MRVLVTGATGLVGSAIASELVSRGHRVRVLVRPTSDLSNLEALPLEVARGDILDRASVQQAVDGCQAVVHAAGLVGFRPGMRHQLMAVNARGVEVVLGAAREAGVRRAVLTSSTSALGGTYRPRVADEAARSNAEALGIDYFVSKLRGEENAFVEGARGLEVVILRPGYVLGPGDLGRSSGATVLAFATGKFPGYVEGGISFCDVRDVAAAHAEALVRGRPGEIYHLGGHNATMTQAVRRLAVMAGMEMPPRIPYLVALSGALVSEAWNLVGLKRPWHLTVDFVRSVSLYTWVSSEKAKRELGYRIRPHDEMLRDTLAWWVARGKLPLTTPELRRLAEHARALAPPRVLRRRAVA
ncbi:MAG TPA: NAD-dependent epimerase/dehydratase family protein [Anaeromyxobacteraceae bacterium]|nr:NAD-dependent epimerase/dehydratase family protein [Anaeromyxobacteraceae bacterium]